MAAPGAESSRHRDAVWHLIQLTDTHLDAEPGGTLLHMDTDHSLASVIDSVRREQPRIDLLLGTGDLADAGHPAAYARLSTAFEALCPDYAWLPGNHDDRAAMLAAVGEGRMPAVRRRGNWQVVLLDSQVPGEVGGLLASTELERLRQSLEAAEEEGVYSLVCLHHQPLPIGCDWLDEQQVANGEDFLALLDAYPRVRGVLWGHVHQQFERLRGSMQLLCSPSTCVQFKPGQREFMVDELAPGYRWLRLYPDGRLESGVSRVQGVQFTVDHAADGYL